MYYSALSNARQRPFLEVEDWEQLSRHQCFTRSGEGLPGGSPAKKYTISGEISQRRRDGRPRLWLSLTMWSGGWPSRVLARNGMPHPWQFHGWAATNSPGMFIRQDKSADFVLVNETQKAERHIRKSREPRGIVAHP